MRESVSKKKYGKRYLLGNLLLMVSLLVCLGIGMGYAISFYTHHGKIVVVPNILHKSMEDAEHILQDKGLTLEVQDTGYVKRLPAGCVLEQSIAAGEQVKPGRTIYITINSAETPTLSLPDVIDNSSLREAMVKLRAMGFKVGTPRYISGERDWVYGILVGNRHVAYGDKIPIDATLIIEVGNGQRDDRDSVSYVDPIYPDTEEEEDEFEEINIMEDKPMQPPSDRLKSTEKEKNPIKETRSKDIVVKIKKNISHSNKQ